MRLNVEALEPRYLMAGDPVVQEVASIHHEFIAAQTDVQELDSSIQTSGPFSRVNLEATASAAVRETSIQPIQADLDAQAYARVEGLVAANQVDVRAETQVDLIGQSLSWPTWPNSAGFNAIGWKRAASATVTVSGSGFAALTIEVSADNSWHENWNCPPDCGQKPSHDFDESAAMLVQIVAFGQFDFSIEVSSSHLNIGSQSLGFGMTVNGGYGQSVINLSGSADNFWLSSSGDSSAIELHWYARPGIIADGHAASILGNSINIAGQSGEFRYQSIATRHDLYGVTADQDRIHDNRIVSSAQVSSSAGLVYDASVDLHGWNEDTNEAMMTPSFHAVDFMAAPGGHIAGVLYANSDLDDLQVVWLTDSFFGLAEMLLFGI